MLCEGCLKSDAIDDCEILKIVCDDCGYCTDSCPDCANKFECPHCGSTNYTVYSKAWE